jgi:hypothetical protein
MLFWSLIIVNIHFWKMKNIVPLYNDSIKTFYIFYVISSIFPKPRKDNSRNLHSIPLGQEGKE